MAAEAQSQNQPPQGIVLTFIGPIQPAVTKTLANACCMAINQKVQKFKILLASNGGSLDDGFARSTGFFVRCQ